MDVAANSLPAPCLPLQEPLTLIYEVFSTALEEFLGPQRQH